MPYNIRIQLYMDAAFSGIGCVYSKHNIEPLETAHFFVVRREILLTLQKK
jgi:hypothetical protein